MRLSRATIPLASEYRTHGQAKSPSSHYNLAPHFWPGFINLQDFCHSRWRNPVRLSKSGETKPAFRKAFERRRCLVPVDNFYEWKKTEAGKQPYAIALADRGLMALAGLWENWHSPTGEWVSSFAIITTMPNELCAELHNRMPLAECVGTGGCHPQL